MALLAGDRRGLPLVPLASLLPLCCASTDPRRSTSRLSVLRLGIASWWWVAFGSLCTVVFGSRRVLSVHVTRRRLRLRFATPTALVLGSPLAVNLSMLVHGWVRGVFCGSSFLAAGSSFRSDCGGASPFQIFFRRF